MNRSMNEVMNLAAKAARGAGAPPAQAVRYGQAVVAHLVAGRDPQDLARALEALPGGPVMALPLALARICETQDATGVVQDDGWAELARSYVDALPFAAHWQAGGTLRIDLGTPTSGNVLPRCAVPEPLLELWVDLAARILVPESEASRLGGAGAGLTDND